MFGSEVVTVHSSSDVQEVSLDFFCDFAASFLPFCDPAASINLLLLDLVFLAFDSSFATASVSLKCLIYRLLLQAKS